ncbi:serine/threonine-protein kinase Chk1-like isoform X1 [Mobula birostris]|uniref:serine/threonine-protein kinase Chk1-like isoform X1 n=1 Tax=Mobula birostris TaxID=1983395 RepID=UPI003B288462
MAVPFVQDWDLLQTLGEGAYEPDVGMPEADADGFFQQLIAGVEYLHNNGITHRGIKPGTLLLGDQELWTHGKWKLLGLSTADRSMEMYLFTVQISKCVHYQCIRFQHLDLSPYK